MSLCLVYLLHKLTFSQFFSPQNSPKAPQKPLPWKESPFGSAEDLGAGIKSWFVERIGEDGNVMDSRKEDEEKEVIYLQDDDLLFSCCHLSRKDMLQSNITVPNLLQLPFDRYFVTFLIYHVFYTSLQ